MTNAKYHRCRRALDRLLMGAPGHDAERAILAEKVRLYRSGQLRAVHGQTRRHPSTVAA